jgi:hypothetical protein
MVKLIDKWQRNLSEKEFDEYPVWIWDDENEGHFPISDIEPNLNEYYPLFIKALFATNDHIFKGYLVGGNTFYAFGLFVNGKEFGFNTNLPEINKKSAIKLFKFLNCKPFHLFPLRYNSDVIINGNPVSGILDY